MRLYIGNKNYSSWSFRPWLAMRAARIDFEEVLIPFDDDAGNPKFREFSPTGKVPVLVDGELTLWESLSILEYLAEKYADSALWPKEPRARAVARSAAAEMHGAFSALRAECPMNMRRAPAAITVSDGVRRDVERIERLWASCLERSGGPFLFGGFSNADAMYAPVVNRLEIYRLSDHPAVLAYRGAMQGLDAWREWNDAARAEPWTVPADEV